MIDHSYRRFHFVEKSVAAAKSLQSCPTLCDPIDGSPPGSSIPGILQARILEWVANSISNAWKWKVKGKLLSRVRLLATPWTAATRLLRPWDFPGKSTGVGRHCLLRCKYYTILYKRLEHSWILVSSGILEQIPWEYQGPTLHNTMGQIVVPENKNAFFQRLKEVSSKGHRGHAKENSTD